VPENDATGFLDLDTGVVTALADTLKVREVEE
jgi:hypothetical protein